MNYDFEANSQDPVQRRINKLKLRLELLSERQRTELLRKFNDEISLELENHQDRHSSDLESSLLEKAGSYFEIYCSEMDKPLEYARQRLSDIKREIDTHGTYIQTYEELSYGAQLAWRNHSRCIGRLFWKSLKVNDCRTVNTFSETCSKLEEHLTSAFNSGNIRSTITIFPQRMLDNDNIIIHNAQLVRYASYLTPNGEIIGDPENSKITAKAMSLGWQPLTKGNFDILPIILEKDNQMYLHQLSSACIREVELEHPYFHWFKELGLRWYSVPVISDMILEIGGLEYPCAPFNGFYMGTEIGSRNFCDESRYNLLPLIAEKLGLPVDNDCTLWKDRAMLEINIAVLHSFNKQGVRITDHHEASDHFIKHLAREEASGRKVPGDWRWIVPPMSSSSLEVFHTEMEDGDPSPRFLRRCLTSDIDFGLLRSECPNIKKHYRS